MAKLEGVKVLDMVNGQITKVEYDGEVYEHIEGTPKKGDIAEIISEWGHQIKGAFYSVIQEDHFLYSIIEDAFVYIDGELKHASSNVENVRLYRKIGESSLPTIEEVNAKVDSLVERVDALEGDKGEAAIFREGDLVMTLADGENGDIEAGEIGEITDMRAAGDDEDDPYHIAVVTEEGFDYFRPQDLELVTASELKIGDYVVPTSEHRYGITTAPNMKLGKVVNGHTYVQDDIRVEIVAHVDTEHIGDSFSVNSKYFRKATDEEIAKYDPKKEPAFKVGDTVRLSVEGDPCFDWGNVENGEIGVVKRVEDDLIKVDFPSQTNWSAKPYELVPLTDEEAKFAKIGRKPGEFKKGDIVRISGESIFGSDRDGEIGEYQHTNADGEHCVQLGDKKYLYLEGQLELIAPVESRVDTQC